MAVISGEPQGILGPTLFVLFLYDIVSRIDPNTKILMYVDDINDIKIWRQMKCFNDHATLQRDINYLFYWAIRNKVKFHPFRCKVLMVSKSVEE